MRRAQKRSWGPVIMQRQALETLLQRSLRRHGELCPAFAAPNAKGLTVRQGKTDILILPLSDVAVGTP